MPKTYEPIATYTVSGSSTTTYTFSSIPGTYTDLVLIASGSLTTDADVSIRVNGDTAVNYSRTRMWASTATASDGGTGDYFSGTVWYTSTSNNNAIFHFMNYSNTTTYKSVLSRSNSTNTMVNSQISMWKSTAAITSITVGVFSAIYSAGSTFTLYGIKAA